MPDQDHEAKTIQTYDKYAAEWVDEHANRAAYQPIIAKFQSLLAGGTILEIGAGGGSDGALLQGAGYNYFGTDASLGMVQAARKAHPDLRFEQLSVYDLGKLHRQFDGFWASAVLLHIPKSRISQALQSIAGAVKAGGIGFISMKDGDSEEFEQRQKLGRQENRLFSYWSKQELQKVLNQNGFEVIDYQYLPLSKRTNWHWVLVRKQP